MSADADESAVAVSHLRLRGGAAGVAAEVEEGAELRWLVANLCLELLVRREEPVGPKAAG